MSAIAAGYQMQSPLGDTTYQPIECQVGDDIEYYETGYKNAPPILGKVYKSGNGWRGVHVIVFGPTNRIFQGVHHIDDPIIAKNKVIESLGAWDFTKAQKDRNALQNELCRLNDRLKTVERFIESGEKKK